MPYIPARRWRIESAEGCANSEADTHLRISNATHSCRPKGALQARLLAMPAQVGLCVTALRPSCRGRHQKASVP